MHATLNGAFVAITPVSQLSRSQMLAVVIHELGHALGLGHSQVNLNCLTLAATCPSNAIGGDIFGVPTMFPLALPQTESVNVNFGVTLAADDISAISTLYPKQPSFSNSTGTIAGVVFFGDGINHFQGANVIARRVGDPRVTAVSNVSGMFAQVDRGNPVLVSSPSPFGSPDWTRRGEYTIPGLPPGTYTVEVESVDPSFTEGSSVGPVGEQRGNNFSLVGECLGEPESNADAPGACETISLNAGDVFNGKNIILNDALATMDASDSLARNETFSIATPLGFFGVLASLSAQNDRDVDVYSVIVPPAQALTAQTQGEWAGAVLELTDSNGLTLKTCRIGGMPTAYNQNCIDISSDSAFSASLSTTSTGTVLVRVTDVFGDARPDFRYNLITSSHPFRPEVATLSPQEFDSQFVGTQQVKPFTVSSIGSADMILGGAPLNVFTTSVIADVFTLEPGSTCLPDTVLPPGSFCTVNIGFRSGTPGHFDGIFELTSNTFPPTFVVLQLRGNSVDFSIDPTLHANSDTVLAGETARLGFTFIPVPSGAGLPADTTFAVSGLPVGAVASFSPSSVQSGLPVSSIIMTITTTRRSLMQPITRPVIPPAALYPLLCVLMVLLILSWRSASHQKMRLNSCAWIALVCIALLGLCGCGGGGSGGSGGGSGVPGGGVSSHGTPAGTYSLTVTATSGPLTRNTTVTLIVQ